MHDEKNGNRARFAHDPRNPFFDVDHLSSWDLMALSHLFQDHALPGRIFPTMCICSDIRIQVG